MVKVCINHVVKEYDTKTLYGYNFNEHDIKLTRYTRDILVISAIICGVLSTLTGMGGGIIYAPVLLALNLHPSVSTSTATLFNFFSSLSNAIFCILSNQVYYDFSLWLLIWTSFGTFLGLIAIKDLIEKTNKTSIVVFMIVIVLGISIFITAINDVNELGLDIQNPTAHMNWGSFCN
jgi:uncharacterized membrane protein YfcA